MRIKLWKKIALGGLLGVLVVGTFGISKVTANLTEAEKDEFLIMDLLKKTGYTYNKIRYQELYEKSSEAILREDIFNDTEHNNYIDSLNPARSTQQSTTGTGVYPGQQPGYSSNLQTLQTQIQKNQQSLGRTAANQVPLNTYRGKEICTPAELLARMLSTAITTPINIALNQFSPNKVPVTSVVDAKEGVVELFGVPILPSWDSIGYCIANGLIKQVSDNIITWINNGFEYPDGTRGPGFITNPGAFFQDIADRTAEQFARELEALPQRIADRIVIRDVLRRHLETFKDRYVFDLDEVIDPEDFYSGRVATWEAYNRSLRPNNNFWAKGTLAEAELSQRIANAQELAKFETDGGYVPARNADGQIVVSASAVKDLTHQVIGSGHERLILADEFDEILDALIEQLLTKVLTEAEGFFGVRLR